MTSGTTTASVASEPADPSFSMARRLMEFIGTMIARGIELGIASGYSDNWDCLRYWRRSRRQYSSVGQETHTTADREVGAT